MNKNILLLVWFLNICSLGLSQDRYLDEVFDEVIITEDVVYEMLPIYLFYFSLSGIRMM